LHIINNYCFNIARLYNALNKHIYEEYDYSGWVYDLEIDDTHKFACGLGNVLVHNTFVDSSIENANPFIISNVLGTQVVIDNCVRWGAERLVYVSTDEVYGHLISEDEPAWKENASMNPRNPYAASKAAGEFTVRQYQNRWAILRLPTMYGPGMREALFVFRVIDAIANNRPVLIHGTGEQSRQYGFAVDVARNVYWILIGKLSGVFNLNGYKAISNLRVVADVARILGRNPTIIFSDDRAGQIFRQDIEVSTEKQYETPWETGIEETVRWYIETYGLDRRSHSSAA